MKKTTITFYFSAILSLVCCKQKAQQHISEDLTVVQPTARLRSKEYSMPALNLSEALY